MTKGGSEGGLPLISFFDVDVVIPPLNIHLGEILGSFQFINEGEDEGEQIGVLDCMLIKISIILARAESSIFLLDEEEQGSLG